MNALKDNILVFAWVKPDAIIPSKKTENAGYDIYACFEEDYIVIPPNSTKLIPTGIAAAVSDNFYLQVHERGSTGSKGMKYGAGVIDSSYRGEIFICINNVNDIPVIISKLSNDELKEKYSIETLRPYYIEDHTFLIKTHALKVENKHIFFDDKGQIEAILYPYSKAIAQLVVHEVPKMDVWEITYEELLQIPSERGTGALGSSNK